MRQQNVICPKTQYAKFIINISTPFQQLEKSYSLPGNILPIYRLLSLIMTKYWFILFEQGMCPSLLSYSPEYQIHSLCLINPS